MVNKVRYAAKQDYDSIKDFFISISDDFFPPIKERGGALERDLSRSLDEGKIAIVENGSTLIGACAYWVDKASATVVYTGVAKQHRGSHTFSKLIKHIINNEPDIQTVMNPTWSENEYAKGLLTRLGFKSVGKIPDHYSPDRITEVYLADAQDIKRFFDKNKKVKKSTQHLS